MSSPVRIERQERVIVLTIDRPEAHNALNSDVLDELRHGVRTAVETPGVRAVVVTGAGEKAFSAGADLKEIAELGSADAYEVMERGQNTFRELENEPIPVIAAVNGLALGGGFELVLSCTIPVLSESASLGLPESSLGLIPGYGGTQRLPRIVGSRVAAHLMLTGERLSARRAYDLGLTPIAPVPPADLMATALGLAERVAQQGPRAVRAILAALEVARDTALDSGLATETGLAALAVAGSESAEGVRAFLERRKPDFADQEAP